MTDRPAAAPRPDPVAPADDDARSLARDLLARARHAALAVSEAATGTPFVSRIALGLAPSGVPLTLVSGLAVHTPALRADPRCAFLVGEPGARGDPLTHPRLTVRARARFIARDSAEHAALRDHWLTGHPKSRLYIDFPDFSLVLLEQVSAVLNGGFARAYALTPADLLPPLP